MRIPAAYQPAAAMFVTAHLGIACGAIGIRSTYPIIGLSIVMAICSLPVMGAAWFRSARRGPAEASRTAWVGCLTCYSAAFVLIDPFVQLNLGKIGDVLFLAPLLIGLRNLVRIRAWLAASGVAMLLFGSLVLVMYNGSCWRGGIGFLSR